MSARPLDLPLRLGVAIAALTAAWVAWQRPTAVNGLLFVDWGLPESTATWVDRGAALTLAASAAAVLLRGARIACALVAAWFLALAIATTLRGGGPFTDLAPAAQAARYGAPLGLLLLGVANGAVTVAVLRVTVALTFVAHGYEALLHSAHFIDLILVSARRLFGWRLSEAEAGTLLTAIGWIDLVLAALVLTRRWRLVAAYMTFWAAVTAASRVTAFGLASWTEVGLRAGHVAAPLALTLHWRAARRPAHGREPSTLRTASTP